MGGQGTAAATKNRQCGVSGRGEDGARGAAAPLGQVGSFAQALCQCQQAAGRRRVAEDRQGPARGWCGGEGDVEGQKAAALAGALPGARSGWWKSGWGGRRRARGAVTANERRQGEEAGWASLLVDDARRHKEPLGGVQSRNVAFGIDHPPRGRLVLGAGAAAAAAQAAQQADDEAVECLCGVGAAVPADILARRLGRRRGAAGGAGRGALGAQLRLVDEREGGLEVGGGGGDGRRKVLQGWREGGGAWSVGR